MISTGVARESGGNPQSETWGGCIQERPGGKIYQAGAYVGAADRFWAMRLKRLCRNA
jgi:hypothetical protein